MLLGRIRFKFRTLNHMNMVLEHVVVYIQAGQQGGLWYASTVAIIGGCYSCCNLLLGPCARLGTPTRLLSISLDNSPRCQPSCPQAPSAPTSRWPPGLRVVFFLASVVPLGRSSVGTGQPAAPRTQVQKVIPAGGRSRCRLDFSVAAVPLFVVGSRSVQQAQGSRSNLTWSYW